MMKRSLAILFALLVALNTASAVLAEDDAGTVTDGQEILLEEETEVLLTEEDTGGTEEVPSEEPVEEERPTLEEEETEPIGCTAEVPADGVLLNTADNIFGTGSWEDNESGSFEKAFDGDISTFYDAYASTIDAHVGVDVGTATQLTEVHIVPRNANGYEADVTVIDGSGGFDNEDHSKLLDGDLDSVWCQEFIGGGADCVIWQTSRPVSPIGYVMYTAYDTEIFPERNPVSWTLYAANDPDGEWDILDKKQDNYDIPDGNKESYEVYLEEVPPQESYEYFKLQIDAVDDTTFQLGEFRLLEGEAFERMEGMTIQGSTDGKFWATLYTFPAGYYAVQPYVVTADEMDFVDECSFTQFRIINTAQHLNVAEVEFYGVENSDMGIYPTLPTGEHSLRDDLLDEKDIFGTDPWEEGSEFDKAFDGNIETHYDASEEIEGYANVGISLDTPAQLTKIVVHPRGDGNEYRMTNLAIQGSVNGEDWITLYQFDDVQDYEYQYYEVTADMLASAAQDYAFTQFRVINKSEHLNVAEVKFYGTYEHELEAFPVVVDEPIYSYLTGEQFVNTAWVYYERDPETEDDDHYMDWWYFNDRGESGEEMTRFEQEFEGREPIVLIGGVGFDDTVLELSDIDGKPIIAVASHAFNEEKGITEVVIDENSDCKYIMGAAFAGCEVEAVTVSNSLREVYTDAFNCDTLCEFIKADGDLSDEEKDERDWGFVEVVNGALISRGDVLIKYPAQADYVESYQIPDHIHHIASWAFSGAQIGEITMGHNILYVNYGAFANSAAHTIKLSPSLQYLGNDVFMGCTNLTLVEIPSDRVEIDCWENEETGATEYTDRMFGDTVDYESEEPRANLVVKTYEGNMIYDCINYIHELSDADTEDDYDMSHVVFEEETETYWYGFDWWDECGEDEVFLVGYSAPLDAEITTMPTETYDGKTIIGIRTDGDAWKAFSNDDRVCGGEDKTFVIPEGIKYIYDVPFDYCDNIETFVLPASLENVSAPFLSCHGLEKFVTTEGGTFYTDEDGVALYYTYNDEVLLAAVATNCGKTSIEVLNGTGCINGSAFEGNLWIEEVILPESLYAIDWWAFGDTPLKSITLPANVDRIMPGAFAECPNLTKVTVLRMVGSFCDPEWEQDFTTVFENSPNVTVYVYAGTDAERAAKEYGWNYATVELEATEYETYTANDGVHLSKVLAKSGDTRFTIPEEVQIIDEEAFAGIEGIETVVFPKNLRYIGSRAFADCGEFEVEFTGLVKLGWEGDSFDNEEAFNTAYEAFIPDWHFDGKFAYILAPSVKEAWIDAWWYTAVDENGVMTVPETVTVDEIEYTVTVINDEALAGYAPNDRIGDEQAEEMGVSTDWTYPTSIDLPDTVRCIGSGAMGSQTYDMWSGEEYGLTSVDLPAGVQYIAEDFVFACWNIEEYTGLDAYGDETSGNPYRLAYGENENGDSIGVIVNTWNEQILHAYPQGNAATEFVMPEGIEVIGCNAVRDAQNLTHVNLTAGDSLYRIQSEAFCNTQNLERVMIPHSLSEIEGAAFRECHSLVAFDMPEGNDTFIMREDDGTLRMDDGATIAVVLFGHIGEDGVYRVSDDVYDIRDGAAQGFYALEELIIPAGVHNIYDWAFEDAANLRNVTIEGTLDYFSIDTFAWARNLEKIIYCGDTLNIHYYSNDNIDDFCVKVQYDENGDEVYDENGNNIREKFELVCLNGNCEVSFFLVDDYDYENGNRTDLDAEDNEFFTLTKISDPYYETYTNEDGVHISRAYNITGDVVLPEEVQIIDNGVFAGIEGITSVTFPKNLYRIDNSAFEGCGEFDIILTGGVQISWQEDSFDFNFEDVYNEHFSSPVLVDNILYRMTTEEDVNEAMVIAWWYDAVKEDGVLTVPETVAYDGVTYKVVSLEDGALSEYAPGYTSGEGFVEEAGEWTYPTSVILPDTIRYIGYEALGCHGYYEEERGDYGLESVTLPAGIIYISEGAFHDSYQIREFNGLETYGESENPYQLYEGSIINTWGPEEILMAYPPQCEKTEYTVSGDIEVIGSSAFRWAEELTTLTFEEGVRVLRDGVVILTGLETLALPNSLEEMHHQALSYNRNMKNFVVNDDHPWLTVHDDGTLRSDNGDTLIAYPTANIGEDRVLTIPDDVKGIGDIAFGGIGLYKLIVPASVEWIGDGAFANNDDLKTAVIEGTLELMNLNVFSDCDNMETIIYHGDSINVFYYEGDDFTIAHEFDNYGTPRKIDFIMPDNTDNITFFIARNDDVNDRDYDTYFPNDNPYFNLLSELPETLYGDVNGDGEVTDIDALYLLRYTLLPERYPLADGEHNYDESEDGEITAKDAAALKNIISNQ